MLTQQELADALDVGVQQIWRWESESTDPASHYVAEIARILDVSADYLLGLVDDPYQMQSELTEKEIHVVSAWRRGDFTEAARVILNSEPRR